MKEKDLILIEFPFGFIEITYRKGNLELVRNVLYTTQIKLDTIIKLAVEFNGPQHYQFFPVYHKSIKDFLDQVIRDLIKKKISDDAGIILLEFPYWVSKEMNINHKIQSYLINEFKRLTGINLNHYNLLAFDHITSGSYRKIF